MDIVFKPEDETTTVMALGATSVFSLARAPEMRLVLIKRVAMDDPYEAVDIHEGSACILQPTDRVILRPGVWCENCADCPKANEVM